MAQLTIEPSADAALEGIGTGKNTNYGSAALLGHRVAYLGGNKVTWSRPIVTFDVSALIGAEITSAKLVRYLVSITNPGQQAILSRCLETGWPEDEVTWYEHRMGFVWEQEGGDLDDAGPPPALLYTESSSAGTHELPGLELFVIDAITNRGGIVSIITRLADESPGVTTEYIWRMKEHASGGWRLVVEYTPAEPTASGHRSLERTAFGAGVRPAGAARGAAPAAAARPARPR